MGLIFNFLKIQGSGSSQKLKKKTLHIILVTSWELFVQLLPGECVYNTVLYFQCVCFQEYDLCHTREWAHSLSLSPRFPCHTPKSPEKEGTQSRIPVYYHGGEKASFLGEFTKRKMDQNLSEPVPEQSLCGWVGQPPMASPRQMILIACFQFDGPKNRSE